MQYVEVINEDAHIDNDNTNEQGVSNTLLTKTKKLLQRASPMKLTRLYPSITEGQKIMIRRADYGGLLEIKCSKLQPDFCKFLMEHFDAQSCCLVFPGRGVIPITEKSVRKVLGVAKG